MANPRISRILNPVASVLVDNHSIVANTLIITQLQQNIKKVGANLPQDWRNER